MYGNGVWNLSEDERIDLLRTLELMSIPRPRVPGNPNPKEDWTLPLAYSDERLLEVISGVGTIPSTWRMKERVRWSQRAYLYMQFIGGFFIFPFHYIVVDWLFL